MPLILVLEYWLCVKLPDDFLLPGLKLCSLGLGVWLSGTAPTLHVQGPGLSPRNTPSPNTQTHKVFLSNRFDL